ncbi:MAG: KdsC family phosphatase [Candidatus Gastranaerophilaceae bacterium]
MIEFGKIKAVITDFDGIFTDGSVYVDANGNQSKRINYLDVMAIAMLIKNGFAPIIVSGENAGALDYLNEKFEKLEVHGGIRRKKELVVEILERRGFLPEEVLYVGDDINDLESLLYCGYKATSANAHSDIKAIPGIYVAEKFGGSGAFREIVDKIPGIRQEFQ